MLHVLFFSFLIFAPLLSKAPFAKIIITSEAVECSRSDGNICICYKQNVQTSFDKRYQVSSKHLKIIVDKNKHISKRNAILPGYIKDVVFSGDVLLKVEDSNIRSDSAHILPQKNICVFEGNVYVTKRNGQDHKLHRGHAAVLKSPTAMFNFLTKRLSFIGSKKVPVTTVISLSEHNPGKKKK